MAEEIVNKHIILEFVYGKKTRKVPWNFTDFIKLVFLPKFHEAGTFGGFGKREQSFILYPADF